MMNFNTHINHTMCMYIRVYIYIYSIYIIIYICLYVLLLDDGYVSQDVGAFRYPF